MISLFKTKAILLEVSRKTELLITFKNHIKMALDFSTSEKPEKNTVNTFMI